MYNHLEGLQLADPQFLNHSHVDVLLGAAFYYIIVERPVVKGAPTEPIAIKTMLGGSSVAIQLTQTNLLTFQ